MESMRRSEVNVRHHPNKVGTNNSVAKESNIKHSKLIGSTHTTPTSGTSSLNKKLNAALSQQDQYQNITKQKLFQSNGNKKVVSTSRNLALSKANSSYSCKSFGVNLSDCGLVKTTTINNFGCVPAGSVVPDISSTGFTTSSISSESKDTNFEYEDEWDIGGIPELLDDLDADIEKSSTAAQQLAIDGLAEDDITVEAITRKIKSAPKSATLNTNLITDTSSSLALPRPLAAQTNSAKKFTSAIKHSRPASIANKVCNSSIKFVGEIGRKTTNNLTGLVNRESKYILSQRSHLVRQLSDGEVNSKIVSTENKSSVLPSSLPLLVAPINCNSESGQKSNTLSVSTFAGFSKGGNLVSSVTNTLLSSDSSVNSSNCTIALENDSLSTLSDQSISGMSSQSSGSSSNNSSAGSGAGGSQGGSQNSGGPGSSSKSNTKMSIDHQATLDKGLKMKIKRTKPGTKTSEAKHEIVKATEQQQQQQQNGSLGVMNSSSLDDNSIPNSSSHHSTSSTISSGTSGSNSNVGSSSGSGSNAPNVSSSNKKHLGNISSSNNSSQGNNHSSVSSNSPATGNGTAGAVSGQATSQNNKRGSSGHRRDKAKEKTAHSNRLIAEKNTTAPEKEILQSQVSEKNIACQCNNDSTNGSSAVSCSNHACIRRSDNAINSNNNVMNQRINTPGNSNVTSGSVPPGIFTPSVGSPAGVVSTAAVTAASLLVATSATSVATTTSPQPVGNKSVPSAPGPPAKEATSCSNIKISSHIAAQLAAAAASTSFINNGSNTSPNSVSGNSDSKLSTSIVPVAQAKLMAPGMISATVHHTISVPANSSSSKAMATASSNSSTSGSTGVKDDAIKSPPAKRAKHGDSSNGSSNLSKEMIDICVGTSVGTITEPDCLGPCEPGTSVTLEGIVWHETEGGVLVVNVTWRGKTYVGTLLDCTRHDWAPPRFCDSPTEELDSRTPKGRGKRGRSAILTPDLSNFTETRSSIYFSHTQVHSKLRNGSTKGGRGASRTAVSATSTTNTTTITSSSSSGNGGRVTPSTSPTAFLPPRSEKRKSKDDSPSPVNGDSECSTNVANASGIPISASGGGLATQPQSLVNPVTGLNVQISTKKCKTASPCAISPVLLECPEQDCSKKYKHANGLRYHQSHAHGSACSMDEDYLQLPEEPSTPTPSPVPPTQGTRPTTPVAIEAPIAVTMMMPIASPSTPPINTSATPTTTAATPSQAATALSPPSQISQQGTTPDTVIGTDAVTCTSTMTRSESSISSSVLSVSSTVTTVSCGSGSATMGGVLSALPAQTALPLPQQQHTMAGGSITAGISGQALSQQQHQNLGITNTNNLVPLLPEQCQVSALSQPCGLKPGVLRFGPQSDAPNHGASASILSLQQQATQGASVQANTLAGQSPQRSSASLATNSESLQQPQQCYSSTSAPPGQNLQQGISLSTKNSTGFAAGKQKKCRKSPGPGEYDSIMTRDNVQSPAYSDISDDSTPVGDPDIIDKSQPPKHQDLQNKKSSDIGSLEIGGASQTIPPLGGYGMYQFYQQQQYLVPPPSSDQQQPPSSNKVLLPSTLVQPSLALATSQVQQQGIMQASHHLQPQQPTLLADYTNKSKDPPLDLMTKSSQQQQSLGHQQQVQAHEGSGNQKDNTVQAPPPPSVNLSSVGPPGGGLPPGLGAMTSLGASGVGPSGLSAPSPAKPISHFYPFNYMSPGYPYNVEPNYGPVSIVSSEDTTKLGTHGSISSSQPQSTAPQHSNINAIKDDRVKESPSPQECSKQIPQQQQLVSTKHIKTEPIPKQEIKQEQNTGAHPQQQQQTLSPQQSHALHPKDLQGLGTYPNIYQRHPMTLAAQQHLSREEELRRYYILSDEQRRQSAVAALRAVQAQNPSNNAQPGTHQAQVLSQHKDDPSSSSQHAQQLSMQQQQPHQQPQKSKSQTCTNTNINTSGNKPTNLTKEVVKQKQEEEVKIKQEGQKPTMETQGPPPPPTSQYFLHPSYIAPTPFSFDPNHPMYRNVLMSAAGPYNAAPYHLPIPRYHAPEDLSRNTGTKALDALHHAASQYYTTHKIHELSERALKSPTSGHNGGPGGPVKVSVSSPNVGIQQQTVNTGGVSGPGSVPNTAQNAPNSGGHLSTTNQSSGGGGIPLNLQPPPSGMTGTTNKSEVLGQKGLSGPGGPGSTLAGGSLNIESHKQQSGASGPNSGNSIGGNTSGGNGSTADSRSPPPQRHVHTHHHTHVGLGYPMYTAPYGAAVLASQQAAAVAVINPFPPGPTK